MHKKGFTLIEILVVITIIGILAAIILATIISTRGQAGDTQIDGQMYQIRNAAELYYDNNNYSYGANGSTVGSCSGASTGPLFRDKASNMTTLISAISTSVGGATNIDCNVSSDGTAWTVAVAFADGSGFECVDSTGVNRTVTAAGKPYNKLFNSSGNAAHVPHAATSCN